MKPHWEWLHDGWVSDFKDWVEMRLFFIKLAHKYPEDKKWHEIIRSIEKLIQVEQKRYKAIYGARFNVNRVNG